MGADATPLHRVTLTRGFWLDRTEVTRGEFAACVAAGRCRWPLAARGAPAPVRPGGLAANQANKKCAGKMMRRPDDLPVTCVTYEVARRYCEEWRGGRLPTEAEWEWAARGGLPGRRYPWGDGPPRARRARFGTTRGPVRVGSYPPNGYGLFDMAGNVWEWTNDWYDRRAYRRGDVSDPRGPCGGARVCRGARRRTLRGGGWMSGAGGLILAYRNAHQLKDHYTVVGFRCARDAPSHP